MADNPNKTAPQDAQRINMSQDHEVRYWTERFGVSRDKLQQSVDRAGPMVKDVERELSGSKTSA
jgi:hypothetical protein